MDKSQINFRLEPKLKQLLRIKLRKSKLNLKVFFIFCIEAYLRGEISITVNGDIDTPPKWMPGYDFGSCAFASSLQENLCR